MHSLPDETGLPILDSPTFPHPSNKLLQSGQPYMEGNKPPRHTKVNKNSRLCTDFRIMTLKTFNQAYSKFEIEMGNFNILPYTLQF